MKVLIKDLEDILGLCSTMILELRRKLKIGRHVSEEDVERLKRLADDIEKAHGKITLSTLNDFMLTHNLEDY